MKINNLKSVAAILESSKIKPDLFLTAGVSIALLPEVINKLIVGDIPCISTRVNEREATLTPLFNRTDTEYLLLNLTGLSQERINEILNKSGLF